MVENGAVQKTIHIANSGALTSSCSHRDQGPLPCATSLCYKFWGELSQGAILPIYPASQAFWCAGVGSLWSDER